MAGVGQNVVFCAYELHMKILALIIVDMIIETIYEPYDVANILKCVQIGRFEQRLTTPWQKN